MSNQLFHRQLGRKAIDILLAEGHEEKIEVFCPNTSVLTIKNNKIIFFIDAISVARKRDGRLVFHGIEGHDAPPRSLSRRWLEDWLMSQASWELARVIQESDGLYGDWEEVGYVTESQQTEALFIQFTGDPLDKWVKAGAEAILTRLINAEAATLIAAQEQYGLVPVNAYNQVIASFDVLKQLEHESGPLFPLLYGVLRAGKITLREDSLAQLKTLMTRLGHTPAAWRALAKMQDLLQEMRHLKQGERWRYAKVAFALVGVLHSTAATPSSRLLATWMFALRDQFDGFARRLPPVWFRRAAVKEEAKQENNQAFLAEYEQAVEWVFTVRPRPDKQQIRAGWAWITRKIAEWKYQQWRASLSNERQWGSSVEAYCDL